MKKKFSLRIRKRHRHYSKKAGLPPGSLIYAGEAPSEQVRICFINYNETHHEEKLINKLELQKIDFNNNKTNWVNVDGLSDAEIFHDFEKRLKLHPLLLEDMMHPDQRPKFEYNDDYLYLFINSFAEQSEALHSEQTCLVLGKNYVLSIQEKSGDEFDKIRERIRTSGGRIRNLNHDYLFVALLDAIVDYYFIILDKLMDRTDNLQSQVFGESKENLNEELFSTRQDLFHLKKSVWPAMQAVEKLLKSDTSLISETVKPFIKDILDHLFQISDSIDSLMEMHRSISDTYYSMINQKLNEVMKVLTVFSSIFLPLSFIAGIYGMNFHNMPELGFQYGYPAVLLFMFIVFSSMLIYFKRKDWW